jgi:Peptidase family M23
MRSLVIAVAGLALAAGAAPASASWRPPTPGAVTRGFAVGGDPFAAGNHRGADFAAAPGERVRAVCTGRVVVARRIGSSGGVVTIACGRWRVSHMPLGAIDVRVGARVIAGDPIGTDEATPAHAGLHVGVRRARERFGYVDPLRFIRRPPPGPVPVIGPPPRPTRPREHAAPRAVAAPREVAPPRDVAPPRPVAAPRAIAPPRAVAAPRAIAPPPGRPLAPWPAWAGLAALLLAATTRGAALRRHGRDRIRTRPTVRGPAAAAGAARDDLPP